MSAGSSQSCLFPSTTDSEGGVSPLWEVEQVRSQQEIQLLSFQSYLPLYLWVIRRCYYCFRFAFLEGEGELPAPIR